MAHEVFICYASEDEDAVLAICRALESSNISCWYSKRDVKIGQDWRRTAQSAIQNSRIFLLISSIHSNASEPVDRELTKTLTYKIPVLVIRIDNEPINPEYDFVIGDSQWLEAQEPPLESHFPQLIEAAKNLINEQIAAEEKRKKAEAARKAREEEEKARKEAAASAREKELREAEEAQKAREAAQNIRQKTEKTHKKKETKEAKAKKAIEKEEKTRSVLKTTEPPTRRHKFGTGFIRLWNSLYPYKKDKRKFWISFAFSFSIVLVVVFLFYLLSFMHLVTMVEPAESGTISPAKGVYYKGHQTVLTATPASGYRFDHWSGSVSGTSTSVNVTMDRNNDVVAHFQEEHNLSISMSPEIGGKVTPSSDAYDAGSTVILTATPASGYRFDHWSGDASGTSTTISVTMDGNKSIVASFQEQYTLSISMSPDIGGTITPFSGTNDPGTTVTLTAAPASGYRFDHWSGDASGTLNSIDVTMDGNKSIVANFQEQYTLTISASPFVGGGVYPASGTYDSGTTITLTATPASGYRFDHWSGDGSGASDSIDVTMEGNKKITANFQRLYTLTVSTNPWDGGTVYPASGTYGSGTTVTLTATPASGYRFDHWSGDASGALDSIIVYMDDDKSIVANFQKLPAATLLFEDDFSNSSSGWYKGTSELGEYAYENGEYSILAKVAGYILWQSTPKPSSIPGDFSVEVDVRKISTSQNDSCGIAFRYADNDNYYNFEIDSGTGWFMISKEVQGEWSALTKWAYSKYIKKGTDINHLKVACIGTRIEVYANGQLLSYVIDTSFSGGKILLATESYTPGSHYHFDNFKFYGLAYNTLTNVFTSTCTNANGIIYLNKEVYIRNNERKNIVIPVYQKIGEPVTPGICQHFPALKLLTKKGPKIALFKAISKICS
jgi:hypothetical protein